MFSVGCYLIIREFLYFSIFFYMSTLVGKHYDFPLQAAQNLSAEHYGRDFEMILHFKAAQHLVGNHYERDFDRIFHLRYVHRNKKEACEHTLVPNCTSKIWKLTLTTLEEIFEECPPPPSQISGYAPELHWVTTEGHIHLNELFVFLKRMLEFLNYSRAIVFLCYTVVSCKLTIWIRLVLWLQIWVIGIKFYCLLILPFSEAAQ